MQKTPSAALLASFEAALKDAADERPLQQLFAQSPVLLRCLVPAARDLWCFDRPPLGSEFIPDFLLCGRNSSGFTWIMLELESPTKPVLTQAGLPSAKLSGAMGQVRDWRGWARDNIAYAHQQLGFRDLDAECDAWIIIGRRASLDPKQIKRYRELSNGNTKVMTFDRLLEAARTGEAGDGSGGSNGKP